jgi:hypothetical protein
MYPMLSDFASAVMSLVSAGRHDILIDLSPVTYVDSATIGCLMDLYRQIRTAGGVSSSRGSEARGNDVDDDRRAKLYRDSRRRTDRRQELRG